MSLKITVIVVVALVCFSLGYLRSRTMLLDYKGGRAFSLFSGLGLNASKSFSTLQTLEVNNASSSQTSKEPIGKTPSTPPQMRQTAKNKLENTQVPLVDNDVVSLEGQWFKDLVPPKSRKALSLLKQGSLTILRRTRLVQGNTERLHRVVQKVLKGECISIYLLGGSITHGYNIGGRAGHGIYWKLLVNWLNEKYPCRGGSGKDKHIAYNMAVGARNSHQSAQTLSKIMAQLDNLDLLFIEFGVNDGFIQVKGDDKYIDVQQRTTEMLIRKVLSYRGQDPRKLPALVYLNLGWRRESMLGGEEKKGKFIKANRHSRFQNLRGVSQGLAMTFSESPVLAIYGIPTFSIVEPLVELYSRRSELLRADKGEMFSWYTLMADRCCHPNKMTHGFIALMIAYQLDQEVKFLKTHNAIVPKSEHDLTLDNPPELRYPFFITVEESEFASLEPNVVDFEKSPPKTSVSKLSKGFTYYADSKGKHGLIATQSASYQGFEVDFNATATIKKIEVGYLQSYQNLSKALIWNTQELNLDENQKICEGFVAGKIKLWCRKNSNCTLKLEQNDNIQAQVLNPVLPKDKVSVLSTEPVQYIQDDATKLFVHVCTLPFTFDKKKNQVGYSRTSEFDAKFKIIQVGVFNGKLVNEDY